MSTNIDLRTSKNRYEKNPFITELKEKMYLQPRQNTVVGQGEAIVDLTTGELKDGVLIGKRKIVDKSQFAKIYASEMSLLYDLSKPAKNIFLYLSRVMNYENEGYINSSEFSKIGYKTAQPILNGIKELIKKEIIAPSTKPHHYWLNPVIVCKGERFAKYIEYVTPEEDKKSRTALALKEKKFKENYKSRLENLDDIVQKKLNVMNEEDQELPF